VDLNLPDRVTVSFPWKGIRKNVDGSWRTKNDDRDSYTTLLDEVRLPPATEYHAFNMSVYVDSNCSRAVDYRFTVSFGSSGSPGSAKEITIPANLIAEVYEHHSTARKYTPEWYAMAEKYKKRIRECLK
jgi:hypothetical protein